MDIDIKQAAIRIMKEDVDQPERAFDNKIMNPIKEAIMEVLNFTEREAIDFIGDYCDLQIEMVSDN